MSEKRKRSGTGEPVMPRDERIATPRRLFADAHGLGEPAGELAPGAGEVIGERMARFVPPGVERGALAPSFALESRREAMGDLEQGFEPVVRFGHTLDGRWMAEVGIEKGTSLHGVGMQADGVNHAGRRFICWNCDFPFYSDKNPALYQSHPWVLAVRKDGTAFGVLFDTPWRSEVDLRDGSAIRFRAEGMPFAAYVLAGPTAQDVCRQLADLTGRMPMPPRWALGYHQCRWSYHPAGKAMRVAEEFRRRRIPCDVIWFDIHYMDRYRVFTFSRTRFPDPGSVNERLHGMGFRSVWMIDPGVHASEEFDLFVEGKEEGHFVHDSTSAVFRGEVWPGECAFPDFTRPETRAWWAGLYKDFLAHGIDGVWNDMNEPSVFDTTSKTVPETCWHKGGDELPAGPHAMYHNVYGMLMVRASRKGMLAAQPERRPFLLTRSNFIGGQRCAATWTGDNSATWTDLRLSLPMVLNLGLSGQPFVGPDLGGFVDETEGDPELFARWMGIGAFLPFMRAHAADGSVDKEPWALGEECEEACRAAIELRYRLLPYLYTVFREAHETGVPVLRPAFFADPANEALRDEDRVALLGPDLLVVVDPEPPGKKAENAPAMPSGDWKKIDLESFEHRQIPEVHLRAGAILPLGPVMQWSDEKPVDPLTLVVALDADGRAEGWLYEDAGDGFGFEKGEYRKTRFEARRQGSRVEVRVAEIEGEYRVANRAVEVVVLGSEAEGAFVGREGEAVGSGG